MLASNCLLNRDRFSPCSKYPFGCIGDDICVCFSMRVYRKKFCSNFNKYMGDIRYLLIREISLYYWINRSKIIVFMICIFVWLYYYVEIDLHSLFVSIFPSSASKNIEYVSLIATLFLYEEKRHWSTIYFSLFGINVKSIE